MILIQWGTKLVRQKSIIIRPRDANIPSQQ